MSLAAYKDLRDHHEDRQDERIAAVESANPELAARIATLEVKTKHITLEGEGTNDEHHAHTRRTQATDRITVDSTADLADATFEAIAHTTNLAGLTLKRGNATTKLVHGSPAASSSLVINATGNGADDKSILTAAHGSGEITLGEGASTITAKTLVLEIVPTLGDAALTVKGSASTSNCYLSLLEGQTNQGFQIVANGGEDALNIIREDDGSTNTLLALKADGQRIQQYFSDDAVEHNRVGVGNLTHLSKVPASSNSVTSQIRIGTGSTEGYNTVASNTSFAIQRVNGSTATDALSITRSNGEVTTQGFTCVGSTTVGGGLAVGGVATVTGNLTVTGATSLASTTATALTVSSSTPTLALVDTNNNSDFRIFLENGHVRFQDTTNANRDFLVANSTGDCNIGVSGQTTAVMGKLAVNGDATFANKITMNAEVYAPAAVIKTVQLAGFTPTGAIQDLWLTANASSFPSVTIPTAQVQAGDFIEVYGSLAEDLPVNQYPQIGSRFQYSIIAPGASGTKLNSTQWSLSSGGDNSSDDAFGYFISRSPALTTAQAAGDVFVGLSYQAANTQSRGIVTSAIGAVSSLQVRVIRPVTVPISL